MSKLALSFSASTAIVWVAISALLAKFPDWIASDVLSSDSALQYVIRSSLKYDLLFVGFLVVFSPPLFWLLKYLISVAVRLIFHASFCLFARRRRLTGLFLTFSLCAVGICAGFFIQSIFTYSYAVSKEFVRRNEINRQRLIEMANSEGESDLPASIAQLKHIVKAYPDDDRNNDLENYIQSFSAAKSSSEQLVSVADRLSRNKQHSTSIERYKLAKEIFPQNATAGDRLASYKQKYESARTPLQAFFYLCKDAANLQMLLKRADEFEFALKEPQSIRRLQLDLDGESGNRIYLQICKRATKYLTFDAYFDDLLADVESK